MSYGEKFKYFPFLYNQYRLKKSSACSAGAQTEVINEIESTGKESISRLELDVNDLKNGYVFCNQSLRLNIPVF